jgi:hypothetical protein
MNIEDGPGPWHTGLVDQAAVYTAYSGSYTGYEDGRLEKNGIPFKEDDILVVLEDDTHITVPNITDVLRHELSTMTTDLLYRAWIRVPFINICNNCPLGAFAYAITRRAARKLVEKHEPCGLQVDLQFRQHIEMK